MLVKKILSSPSAMIRTGDL